MIVVRVWGGIGNQLFEYAFGCYLKEMFNCDVYYDLNTFQKIDKVRVFELDLIANDLPAFKSNKLFFSKYRGVKNRLLRYWFMLDNKYINEVDFDKSGIVDNAPITYLEGYWQTHLYVSQLVNPLEFYFTPKGQIPLVLKDYLNTIEADPNSIAIHVRRGDYFQPHNIETYGVCTKTYYCKAANYLLSLMEICSFYIFTDDENWVKENIPTEYNYKIIKSFDQINDFWYIHLMSKCRHNIISNSSFSWWGAYLNSNPEKIIISPDKWTLKSNETISLDNWVKIQTHE